MSHSHRCILCPSGKWWVHDAGDGCTMPLVHRCSEHEENPEKEPAKVFSMQEYYRRKVAAAQAENEALKKESNH